MKFLVILMATTLSLFAYSDHDLDGVSDSKDLCPNTSFDQFVDHYGCPEQKDVTLFVSQELSSGAYGGSENVSTSRTSYFAAYSTNSWSYSLSTSTVTTKTGTTSLSGSGDLYATLSYDGLKTSQRLTSLQVGVKMATASTDIGTGEDDYNIRMSNVSLDGAYSYLSSLGWTLTGDGASELENYNDYISASIGIGHQQNKKLYLSAALNYASEYLDGADHSLSSSIYMAYTVNKKIFLTASYSLGMSDAVADSAVSISLGAKF